MKGMGADSNAFTTDDWTAYHTTASADAAWRRSSNSRRIAFRIQLRPARLSERSRAVLGEYNKIASSPLLLLDETMQDVAYESTPTSTRRSAF